MADPRSYAGTVLPSGGVDPLRLMGQIQASKAKANKPASMTALPGVTHKAYLKPDAELIEAKAKELHGKLASLGPNAYVVGTPEREQYIQANSELQRMIEQAAADRDAYEKGIAALNQGGAGSFWEEDVADFHAQAQVPMTQRKGFQPFHKNVNLVKEVDAIELVPEEWGTSSMDDTGTMITTTSGKGLSRERLARYAPLLMGNPEYAVQAERDALRMMKTDPDFAQVVAKNEEKGYTPGTTYVTELMARKAFGGTKEEMKQSGVDYDANQYRLAESLIEEHSAFLIGKADKYDQGVAVENINGVQMRGKVARNVPAYNKEFAVAMDKKGDPIYATGDWFFEPTNGHAYMKGVDGKWYLQDPYNQKGNYERLGASVKIPATAIDAAMKKKGTFQQSTGTTNPLAGMKLDKDFFELKTGGAIPNKPYFVADFGGAPQEVYVNFGNGTYEVYDKKGTFVKSQSIPQDELKALQEQAKKKGIKAGVYVPGKTSQPQQSTGPFIPGK